MRGFEQILGKEDARALTYRSRFGEELLGLGKFKEAKGVFQAVLKAREKKKDF